MFNILFEKGRNIRKEWKKKQKKGGRKERRTGIDGWITITKENFAN